MKKTMMALLVIFSLVSIFPSQIQAAQHNDDMRAVWMATVSNIDFPSVQNKNNATAQKQEFIKKLDRMQEIGINTIMVQVRPKADALYVSNINPWSDVLTGTQGLYPGYDPLAFMIEETHKRGMDIHAWLNPYRVTQSGTDLNSLSLTHPARLNPEWVMSYNNAYYYNPALEEVKQHIVDTVEELVKNYDIDGIHFDDYFYPSNYPLPAGEDRDGPTANARREHINDMVKRVSKVIERTKPNVMFGISPIGIWKNQKSDPTGSNTGGGESYYTVCADTRTWIQNEWIDYVVPQIYWETTHQTANYKTLVEWWSNEVKGTKVKLYIGQGIYKDTVAEEMITQLKENEKYPQIEGSIYFSMKDLMNNRKGVSTALQTYYKGSWVDDSDDQIKDDQVDSGQTGDTSNPELVGKMGVVTEDSLNFREGPGTTYSSIGKLNKGTKVTIFAEANGWYQVGLTNGQVGFVSSNYVRILGDNEVVEEEDQEVIIPPNSNDQTVSDGTIKLIIKGKQVKPPVAPFIQNGTTLVPLRIISENLGAEVEWESESRSIIIQQDNNMMVLTIDSKKAMVNGKTETLLEAPQMVNGTTMVPIRFISEKLGAKVDWNSSSKIITIE
ncbi:family 10 glycosylhydrolase [Niameybacter massiliensis]|uniref:Family 10 glycosylhydrolase n=1 Tax=Holtiella tumoricola TaxID=3018743 RepID=A0AA42DK71_9FIRM|nr:family 10 glycosylhydrolase [Holtiella tumoricola]MDA3730376.1 family 10 glycosylhydrolase [Holtiella tumoricola]